MRRIGFILLVLSQVAAISPVRPVERIQRLPPPAVSAPAWILYDATNDVVLGGVAVDEPRPMASTTKIMTGLLAIESGRMDEMVVVSQRADDVGEAEIGLVAGEEVRMDMLVNALVIRSGNDAAMAVAEHLGGTVEGFVAMMNARASELGLVATSFANPHGLDGSGHHSSPRDLLALGRYALENETFAEIAATQRYRISDAPDGTVRVAQSTNRLLDSYPGMLGGKTGFTFRAGLVLVGAAEREGRQLHVVVMGSEGSGGHFNDAAALLDYGFDSLRIIDTIGRGTPFRLLSAPEDIEMAKLATLQTMIFLAALQAPPEVEVAEDDRDPEPGEILSAELPGLRDAFTWIFGGLLGG